jgi:hypothetical protein
LEPLGEPYRSYRTVVAWYCWRAVELYADGADRIASLPLAVDYKRLGRDLRRSNWGSRTAEQ